MHAAGVDRGVWHLVAGLPYPVRLAGYGIRAPKTRVPGREVAGRVEAVGRPSRRCRSATRCSASPRAPSPSTRGPGQTSSRPSPRTSPLRRPRPCRVSGLTALQAVRDRGHVQAGQQVLVIGASGGVGTFAVQIAKAYGADVTGVCSTAKADMVRSIGADRIIDYTREDIADGGHRYDVILDTGGNRPLRQLRRALTPRGTLVIIGGETDGRWLGGSDRQLRAVMLSPFTSQHLTHAALLREQGGPHRAHRNSRVRPGHTGHRQGLPAERDHRGHPVHARRSRPGQGRRQPLKHKPRRIPGDQPALRLPLIPAGKPSQPPAQMPSRSA